MEIRSLDLNVFDPVGINQNTIRFMESFLIYCLLEDSPMMTVADNKETMKNHMDTANFGRDPDLFLSREGKKIGLKEWAQELMEHILKIADLIDQSESCSEYVKSVEAQIELIKDSKATPSARILQELSDSGLSFADYGLSLAEKQKNYFSNLIPLNAEKDNLFEKEAQASILKQADAESIEQLPLSAYLNNYFKS